MLSVEIKINGITISTIYGRNEEIIIGRDKECQYYYEYYQPEKPLITGRLMYQRSLGINKLLIEILKRIEKQKGE